MTDKKPNGQSRPQPTDDQLRIAELENRCLALSDRIEALVGVIGQHERNGRQSHAPRSGQTTRAGTDQPDEIQRRGNGHQFFR